LEAGTFADGVYQNAGLGLAYQFPFKSIKKVYESPTKEPRHGKKRGPARTGVAICWSNDKNVYNGPSRDFDRYKTVDRIEIFACNDQYYSGLGDARTYLQGWKDRAKDLGFQIPGDVAEHNFNGQSFYEFEYVDRFGSKTRVVKFATVWRGYLLAFEFTTDDITGVYEETDRMMSSMNSVQLTDPGSPEAIASPHPTDGSSDPLK
jgi:hypothetical protein